LKFVQPAAQETHFDVADWVRFPRTREGGDGYNAVRPITKIADRVRQRGAQFSRQGRNAAQHITVQHRAASKGGVQYMTEIAAGVDVLT
jgi:hypothetical protein